MYNVRYSTTDQNVYVDEGRLSSTALLGLWYLV